MLFEERRKNRTNPTSHARRADDRRRVLVVDDGPNITLGVGVLAAMSIASDTYTPPSDPDPTPDFGGGGGDSGGGGASGSFDA